MFSDFGKRSFSKRLKKVVQRTTKVISKPITGVRKLAHGDIKGASKALLDATNPFAAVVGITSDSTRKMDWARLGSPLTVVNIENRDLRKKAAIGYAVAAVVAGAVVAAGALAASGAATAATGATGAGVTAAGTGAAAAGGTSLLPAGLTTAAGTAGKYLKDAKSITDLAMVGKSMIGKKKGGDEEEYPQERAGVEFTDTRIEKEIKHTNWMTYSIIGASILGIVGIGYYLTKTK